MFGYNVIWFVSDSATIYPRFGSDLALIWLRSAASSDLGISHKLSAAGISKGNKHIGLLIANSHGITNGFIAVNINFILARMRYYEL